MDGVGAWVGVWMGLVYGCESSMAYASQEIKVQKTDWKSKHAQTSPTVRLKAKFILTDLLAFSFLSFPSSVCSFIQHCTPGQTELNN